MIRGMDAEAKARLEASVAGVLARMRGEVVVVVARSSGSYRDVDHLAAAIVVAPALVLSLFAHYHDRSLPDDLTLPALVVLYVATLFVDARLGALRRLLTSRARRQRQVRAAARAAFVRAGVGRDAERASVLVYVSLFERAVEIVPGLGAEGRVEGARWAALAQDVAAIAAVDGPLVAAEKAVGAAGELLAKAFPREAGAPAPATPRVLVPA